MKPAQPWRRGLLAVAGALALASSGALGAAGETAPRLNEFVLNHTGTDFNEYVEILGLPNSDYFDVWVLSIEGDSNAPQGRIDAAQRFGTSDARGLVTTRYQTNRFENGTNTLLLVSNFSGAVGDNVDPGGSGKITATFWDELLDSIAVSDGGADDVTYADLVLAPDFDGGQFTVGGASLLAGLWVRNDFFAEGIPGFNGELDPAVEALNTPADPNARNYASGGGEAPAGLRIHDVQGIAHRSAFEGQAVAGLDGVVTAIDTSPSFARGFYLQEADPDDDPRSSEGVFVLTGSTDPGALGVAVDSLVEVDGVVEEERPAANVENLTTTRIRANADPATQVRLLGGAAVIPPTILGQAGLLPPDRTISSFEGFIEDAAALELSDGLDFYESLEGMLLEVSAPQVISPPSRFGEVWVVADGGAGASGINPRGGITLREKDFNPERIQIDDGIVGGAVPVDLDVGARLEPVVGVLRYDFENFEIDTLAPLAVLSDDLTREITELKGARTRLTVATLNVENLDPGDGARFDELAAIIVENLKAPDILALQEVQDDSGPTDDGTVSADQTFGQLIAAIETADPALAGVYGFAQIDPEDGRDGGQPGGNIRVGFLFRQDRTSLAPGDPGDATSNTAVLPGPSLSFNPGRVLDPDLGDGDAFASSRKPLAAEFRFGRNRLFIVANHFNSKGGDQPLFGPSQRPTLISEAQRKQQAQVVNDFVDAILAEDRWAKVIVLGDVNDFPFSPPLDVLRGTATVDGDDEKGRKFPRKRPVLKDLVSRLPATDRYTFIFDGNSQALDNILVSRLLGFLGQVDVVHVNSEFSDQASDHDPVVASFRLFGGFREFAESDGFGED
ncbi:MAG: endonuclease/exonuclease/phosphatase family protein [Kiloniellales bacterium]|nr:endonuclease/exonuclease/phosphatase family protein [Kiloniellales bacterium]